MSDHRHHWRPPLVAGIIGAGIASTGRAGMLGRFLWRLGVFLAAVYTVFLLVLLLIGEPQRSELEVIRNIGLAVVVGDAVILGLAAGLAWVCGGAPWARPEG